MGEGLVAEEGYSDGGGTSSGEDPETLGRAGLVLGPWEEWKSGSSWGGLGTRLLETW